MHDKQHGWSYQQAQQSYYHSLQLGSNRAEQFSTHTSYEEVEKEIRITLYLDRAPITTLADIKKDHLDTYNFLMNLKHKNNEMKGVCLR